MLAQEQRLGRYTILRPLGIGGMAVVYLCERQGMGGFKKQVVAKVIRPEHAENREFVLMLLDEARLSATLNHPNVVQVFEVDEVDGAPCLIMEYVHGPSLARLVARADAQKVLHYGHLAMILAGIARGLHHAHFGDVAGGPGSPVRIVHRDVSLQNILVSTEGTPKLIDFGIAKAEGRLHETRMGIKGKLSYLAPEQLRGDPVDYRSDLYSLGICLYRGSTATYPYGGDSVAETMKNVLIGKYPTPTELVPGYPVELERIALRALSANPQDRFPSGIAFANALEQFAVSGPWQSDRRGVAEWIEQLFPRPEDWLGRHTTNTATNNLFSAGTGTGAPRRVSLAGLDPARLPSGPALRSGLLMVGGAAFVTMVIALVALFVVLGFLVTQSARLARMQPRSVPVVVPLPVEPTVLVAPTPAPRAPPAPAAAPTGIPPGQPLGFPTTPPQPGAPPAPPRAPPEPSPWTTLDPPPSAAPDPVPTVEAPAPAPMPASAPALSSAAGSDLPADYTIRNIEQIKVVLSAIEEHAVKAGVDPSIARNVTGPLTGLLVDQFSSGSQVQVHPRAIFDRILSGAASGFTGGQIGLELRKAQVKGTLK